MINPVCFVEELKKNNVNFFSGVPDSLLKYLSNAISLCTANENHIIASSEGGAVGLGIGSYLSTSKVPLIYLQNSGLGNIINPILSLADNKVYGIPMLFVVGWRGEPGIKDEPQHIKQGAVTIDIIKAMGFKYEILSKNSGNYREIISKSIKHTLKHKEPFFILVKKNTFSRIDYIDDDNSEGSLTREEAIKEIYLGAGSSDIFLTTTGMASRELYEIRCDYGEKVRDFLCVGGMGHVSQIAATVALNNPNRRVICIDGDGAMLMHMGGMAIIGSLKLNNFYHVLINNGAHESVGGQRTVCGDIDFSYLAHSLGYNNFYRATDTKMLSCSFKEMKKTQGSSLLEVVVKVGHRSNLGRPKSTPEENKNSFMRFVQSSISSEEFI